MKKILIGIVVCMLLITTVLSVSGTVIMKRVPVSTSFGDTLYVGGSGPGNYSTIQGAINDASGGDTVFVYDDSSPYYENLIVDKSINLIGENRDTTIINSQSSDEPAVIQIESAFVTIQSFTIDGDNDAKGNNYYGIRILSHYNEIKDNIIRNGRHVIMLGERWVRSSDYNNISGNIIIGGYLAGIVLDGASSYNTISHNEISSNSAHGVFLRYENCRNNTINNNYIHSNGQLGIWLMSSDCNIIKHNTIVDNGHQCILIDSSYYNQVIENNIHNDDLFAAGLSGSIRDMRILNLESNWVRSNTFDSNYWGKARGLPQPISAWAYIFIFGLYFFTFDMNPASEPYDIGV